MKSDGRTNICPDCGGILEAIKLVASGPRNPISGVGLDTLINTYTGPTATWSMWSGITSEGQIQTMRCSTCCRVFMYAFSKDESEVAEKQHQVNCLNCGTVIATDESTCCHCGWTYHPAK